MGAKDYKKLFKNDHKECQEITKKILIFLSKKENQKKAAKLITKLINKKASK